MSVKLQTRKDQGLLLDNVSQLQFESRQLYVDGLSGQKVVNVFGMPIESDGKLIESGSEANTYGLVVNHENALLTSSASSKKYLIVRRQANVNESNVATQDHAGSLLSISAIKLALSELTFTTPTLLDSISGDPHVSSKATEYTWISKAAVAGINSDGLNLVTNLEDFTNITGTFVDVAGPDGQIGVNFDGSQRAVAPGLTGEGIDTITSTTILSFSWFARTSEANANMTIFSNGHLTGTEPGMQLNFNGITGELRIDMSDGVGTNGLTSYVSQTHGWQSGEWSHYALTIDFADEKVYWWINGLQMELLGLDIKDFSTSFTYPFTPARDFTLGSNSDVAQTLAYTGDLSQFIMVQGHKWGPDDIRLLCNFGVGKTYANLKSANQEVLLLDHGCYWVGNTSLRGTCRVNGNKKVTVRCYQDAGDLLGHHDVIQSGTRGLLVGTIAGQLPVNEYIQWQFTGLTDTTDYHITYENEDGFEASQEGRWSTTPTGHVMDFDLAGCIDYDYTGSDKSLIVSPLVTNGSGVLLFTGDNGYPDGGGDRTDLASYLSADDYGPNGRQVYLWDYLHARVVVIPVTWASDHDGTGTDNGDKDSAGTAAGMEYFKLRFNPDLTKFPNHDHATVPSLEFSHDLTDEIRIIGTDQRSQFNSAAEPTGEIINDNQLTALDTMMRTAYDDDVVVILGSERPLFLNDTPLTSEHWESYPINRDELIDLVKDQANAGAKSIESRYFRCDGDVHSQASDNGLIQSQPYGTGGSTGGPALLAGRLQHSSAGSVQADEYNQYNSGGLGGWFDVSFTNNAGDVDVSAQGMINQNTSGSAFVFTLDITP